MNPLLVQKASELIAKNFSSDQNFHILQQPDGTYRKTYGRLTPQLIEDAINGSKAVGSYQKHLNGTVTWLCFDFDVKSSVEESKRASAIIILNDCVRKFCDLLQGLNIPFSRENSGNRGQHIWIFFEEEIGYSRAYEIASAICDRATANFDAALIALDRFPPTRMPSAGPGLGVKLPLAKHKKSNKYSFLLQPGKYDNSSDVIDVLCDINIDEQIQLLENIEKISKYKISDILGVPIWDEFNENSSPHRIRKICLSNARFSVSELIDHWSKTKVLKPLAEAIKNSTQLNNNQRKLIVGILINVEGLKKFSHQLLHEIFSTFPNYDQSKTEAAMQSLSGFYFPSQEQIESIVGFQFKSRMTLPELLKVCIPHYRTYEDATFEISAADCDVTKSAEIGYVYENDEAIVYSVVNKLILKDGGQFSSEMKKKFSIQADSIYEHIRQETEEKQRRLISLGANERVITSAIVKQIDNFLDFEPSVNSFGYRIQRNFKDSRIFQPWLVRWSNFISDIDNVIEDKSKLDYIVIKTDISAFYDKIPHEFVRRMMLGGGGNVCINKKYSNLDEKLRIQYHSLVDKIFEINSATVSGLYGLPQGPAYARYLAELYLDEVDRMLDDRYSNGEISFYHRYVDDIFILCRDTASADETIRCIRDKLTPLGLQLNESKTVLAKVGDFYMNFDKYRKQAKYVADKASRGLEDASPRQRSEAINAFMQVLKGDSASDDLTFIFSHFRNVPEVDDEKLKMVAPVLGARLGRGRMMKHLFQFIVEDESRWHYLNAIEFFSDLQAEVLSGTLLDFALSRISNPAFFGLVEALAKTMPSTNLVKENMCFLHLITGANVGIHFDREVSVRCAVLMPTAVECPLPDRSVSQIISALNAERSLPKFCHALYLLSFGTKIEVARLNQLAQVFFAKIGRDENAKSLSWDGNAEMYSVGVARKFYELLCLFSMSNHGSVDLVKASWRFCSDIFERVSLIRQDTVPCSWYGKLPLIELDKKKINLVLASILEGNISPGSRDARKAFDRFHNTVIYHVASGNSADLDEDTVVLMEKLRKKALFYDWLIEKTEVSHFPSREFFEKNAFDNDCIMLRKGGMVLIRRPIEEIGDSSASGYHAGYVEILVPYDLALVTNIDDILNRISFSEKLSYLESLIAEVGSSIYSNIFSRGSTLDNFSFRPFTDQLNTLSNILYEDATGKVIVLNNNIKNFVDCFFRSRDGGAQLEIFYELGRKYVDKLKSTEIFDFLKRLNVVISSFSIGEDKELLDRCVAAALWGCIDPLHSTRRIAKFIDTYQSFTRSQDDLHIFCVDSSFEVNKSTPIRLCETVMSSIEINWKNAAPGLPSFINEDIIEYLKVVESVLERDESQEGIKLEDFSLARVQIISADKVVYVGNEEYPFEKVYLVNVVDRAVQGLNLVNSFFVNVSQHVFVYTGLQDKILMLGLDKSIGWLYDAIEKKSKKLGSLKFTRSYQPVSIVRYDFNSYGKFEQAVNVVAMHRDILPKEAKVIISEWVEKLPRKFHEPLIDLIAGHVVMQKSELDKFSEIVEKLLRSEEPFFFLKDIADYNGTYRLIYRKPELGRMVPDHGPESLAFGISSVTLVVDNVITGSQIINSMKYYVDGTGDVDSAYFSILDPATLRLKLLNLKMLNIRQVLYTSQAISRIQEECRTFMSPDLVVTAVGGRDIGDNAFFGGSNLITSAKKEIIIQILQQNQSIDELKSYIDLPESFNKIKNINDIDLVARYQSLPKKCFTILHCPLRNGQEAPFMKIGEVYEQTK